MADNQNHQLNTDQIRQLLSPYLDGEVTDEERAQVEQALAVSAELQNELETLRRTIALVAALPPMPAPRPFTLTEADVRAIAPAPKSLFGLPAWAKGWAALAATLLCTLAAAGLFWSMQFGDAGQQAAAPAAEIASVPESAATATTAEVQSAAAPAEAPVEEPAEAAPTEAESMMMAEPAAEEEAVPAAEESMAEEPQEKAMAATPTDAESPVETLAQEAAPTAEGPEDQAITATEADQTAPAQDSAAVGAAGPATPSPAPTSSPTPQPITFAAPVTEEAIQEEALSAADAEGEQATTESAAAAAPAEPAPPEPQEREILPRSVEVENLNLQISPGLIEVSGAIEATPGSTLSATLQRNGEPFDNWADPATLQTVVQPNGQFLLAIQAGTGRTDQDLFAIEPANYQITLIGLAEAEPIVATVLFDTFGPPAVATATATAAPPPSPTPVARVTFTAPVTPIGTPTAPGQTQPPNTPGWLIGAGIAVLGVLVVIIGLVIWLIRQNQKRGPR